MKARYGLSFILLLSVANATELKQETIGAWDNYVQTVTKAMQERLAPGRHFLWTDELPARVAQVRSGEVVAAPIAARSPQRAPSGLIHHWIGAAFFASTKLDDVMSVVRDYGRYKDYYRPNVVDSKAIVRSDSGDKFSMLLINKFVVVKMALDSEYESSYSQVDAHRWYSVSRATRVQEIENYGQSSQQKLQADHGSGYIWRLFSITRFEERDGGVYVEVEAVALSRDIPFALRWVVEPIVSRVSRSSVVTSLRQTQDAVRTTVAAAFPATPAASPASTSQSSAPLLNSFHPLRLY